MELGGDVGQLSEPEQPFIPQAAMVLTMLTGVLVTAACCQPVEKNKSFSATQTNDCLILCVVKDKFSVSVYRQMCKNNRQRTEANLASHPLEADVCVNSHMFYS